MNPPAGLSRAQELTVSGTSIRAGLEIKMRHGKGNGNGNHEEGMRGINN
jgi:hypothetical protein